jgi:hypothetical protein
MQHQYSLEKTFAVASARDWLFAVSRTVAIIVSLVFVCDATAMTKKAGRGRMACAMDRFGWDGTDEFASNRVCWI